MTTTCKFKRLRLYVNTGKETLAAVMAKTGATHGSNGGFYNTATFKPVMRLKADGQTLSTDIYPQTLGYAWDSSSGKLILTDSAGAELHDNFITAVCMVKDRKPQEMYYGKDVDGRRGRTGIGTMEDCSVVWYVGRDGSTGAKTPQELRAYFHDLGAKDALMLDGGGSTQGVFDGSKVTSSRIVQNYIVAWADKPFKNRYAVPKKAIRKGAKGNNVRWLQTMLREMGVYIGVDGSFGPATDTALRQFQKFWALDVDGSCGPATRARLVWAVSVVDKGICSGATQTERLLSTAAYEIGTTEPRGDDKYINWYNAATERRFSIDSTHWCAIFVSWCLRRAGVLEADAPNFHSCTAAMKDFMARGKWKTVPKSGDLIFFDWDGSGNADHVGIVAKVYCGKVTTIEGNTGDAVRLREYTTTDKRIRGYAEI